MLCRLLLVLSLPFAACGSRAPTPTKPLAHDSSAAGGLPAADAAEDPSPPTLDGSGAALYPVNLATWPGDGTVIAVTAKNAFGDNMSGLIYEPATATTEAVLWAVQNEPAKIHRLSMQSAVLSRVTEAGWATGKSLRYPGGTGSPDSEGFTLTEWTGAEMYVVAERDNDNKDVPRQSILRYELTGTKGVLDATHEWNLTADLPAFESNSGVEGIAWIPDAFLVERGFYDESKLAAYDPAIYPNHGTGLFFVGVDITGMIYVYALNHADGTFARLTSFPSAQSRSTDLTFDRDLGVLWSLCDSKCEGRTTVFEIDPDPASPTVGRFVLRATIAAPKGIRDLNVEGFTMAPDSTCAANRKLCFWTDDKETGGYAIRKASLPCGRFF
jgi:hypothetical protein